MSSTVARSRRRDVGCWPSRVIVSATSAVTIAWSSSIEIFSLVRTELHCRPLAHATVRSSPYCALRGARARDDGELGDAAQDLSDLTALSRSVHLRTESPYVADDELFRERRRGAEQGDSDDEGADDRSHG